MWWPAHMLTCNRRNAYIPQLTTQQHTLQCLWYLGPADSGKKNKRPPTPSTPTASLVLQAEAPRMHVPAKGKLTPSELYK